MRGPAVRRSAYAVLFSLLAACGGEGDGPEEIVTVPRGASFGTITDSLAAHGLVRFEPLFRLYARAKGAEASVKAGTYVFRRGVGWDRLLEDLTLGRVATQRLTIPEAWTMYEAAPRIAELVGLQADSVLTVLEDSATAARFGVPGPMLEGYLYPATYTFPLRVSLDSVLAQLTRTYQQVWTPARRALADSLGLSEREVVTLASIVESEARVRSEMPRIASVFLNRLDIGMPLQADPTVQYALGTHQSRLLYAHIDSVADHPYNTYRRPGLPPGPIASPSAPAIDAVLRPDSTRYLYFVAAPDGSHIFTRSLAEHNRARQQVRRMAASTAAAGDSLAQDTAGRRRPATRRP